MTLTFRAHLKDTNLTIDSPLTPFWFPGGEAHIKGVDEQVGKFDYQIADLRGADPRDLIMVIAWAQAVRSRNEEVVLFLPYLPAARADRGVPNLHVYTTMIFEIEPDQIIYLDPHSPEWIRDYTDMDDITKLTEFPFERIIRREIQDKTSDSRPQTYAGVIAPDKGAHDRAARAARVMGVPVYTAGKTRDFETGKLTGFHMEDELPAEGKFLIVDDICDGGGTFIGLAQAIELPPERLDLWVTHGIFSKVLALKTMTEETFGVIHTTNSYPSDVYGDMGVHRRLGSQIIVHDILPYFTEAIDVD
jgi:phosphoribosylpyrophosphate synthetase